LFIRVVPYDPFWEVEYENESQKIKNILKDILVEVYHIYGDDVGLVRDRLGGRILAKDDPTCEIRSESGEGGVAWDHAEIIIGDRGAKLGFLDAGKLAVLIAR
jgi:hypothetical protein